MGTQVASVSEGVFNADDGYYSFIEQAMQLAASVPKTNSNTNVPTSTYHPSAVSSSAPSPALCTQCDNKVTTWMTANSKTYEEGSDWHIQNKCNSDSYWVQKKFCRQSCYDADRGYEGDICCSNNQPTLQPTYLCNLCDDTPPSWTDDCSFITRGEVSYKCSDSAWWVNNKFCR